MSKYFFILPNKFEKKMLINKKRAARIILYSYTLIGVNESNF